MDSEKKEYALYFDGASKGNPGLGGIGFVIYDLSSGSEICAESRYIGKHVTNNYAEYTALYLGLEKALSLNLERLIVYGDSLLIVKQMNGEYSVNSLNIFNLHKKSKDMSNKFLEISYNHVSRNKNRRADALANEGVNSRLAQTEEPV
jgi:ribonuclease HI